MQQQLNLSMSQSITTQYLATPTVHDICYASKHPSIGQGTTERNAPF